MLILFNFSSTFKWQICYKEFKYLLNFTINIRKSHRQPQCTLQSLCENRVTFVRDELRVSICRQRDPNASGQFVSCISLLTYASLFIQPHKQISERVRSGDSNCSVWVSIQNYTDIHITISFLTVPCTINSKITDFFLNISVCSSYVLHVFPTYTLFSASTGWAAR
jgi:hypothetical protein